LINYYDEYVNKFTINENKTRILNSEIGPVLEWMSEKLHNIVSNETTIQLEKLCQTKQQQQKALKSLSMI
jgi:hypothetical protein